MKSSALKQHTKESHLKLVKNSSTKKQVLKTDNQRIYINTLIPGFNYINHIGNLVIPKKCALI